MEKVRKEHSNDHVCRILNISYYRTEIPKAKYRSSDNNAGIQISFQNAIQQTPFNINSNILYIKTHILYCSMHLVNRTECDRRNRAAKTLRANKCTRGYVSAHW